MSENCDIMYRVGWGFDGPRHIAPDVYVPLDIVLGVAFVYPPPCRLLCVKIHLRTRERCTEEFKTFGDVAFARPPAELARI